MRRPLFLGLMALALVLAACNGELVDPAVTDVIVIPEETTVAVGATRQFDADVRGPGWPPQSVEWASNNEAVATVSRETGLVRGVAPGTAIITAISTFDRTKSGTATVRVSAASPPPPDPWANAIQVTAVASSGTPIRSNESVTRAAPDFYQVRLPATLSQPLVYVELANVLGGDAVVEVFSRATPRESIYTSQTLSWFGLSEDLTSLDEDELEALRVDATIGCRGPCIIFPRENPGAATDIFVRVSTAGATTVRYNLHVYDDNYSHTDEPQVSNCQAFPRLGTAAVAVPPSVESPVAASVQPIAPASIIVEPVDPLPYRGALETVGNVDCYEIRQNVNRLELTGATANTGINIVAEVFAADTNEPLDFIGINPRDRVAASGPLGGVPVKIVVYSSNNRAGPSEASWYEINVLD